MNFQNLAQQINENVINSIPEGRRGRAPNPEIEKLVKQGLPYWKARAMVRKGMASGAAPVEPVAPSDVEGDVESEVLPARTRGDAKTQAAIDDFIAGNPDATVEDVINHLNELEGGPVGIRIGYNTDPEAVKKMVDIAKGGEDVASAAEPAPEDIGADDDEVERLTNLAMKLLAMPKDQRAEFMKSQKSAPRKKTSAAAIVPDVPEDEDEGDVDPDVQEYVKGMRGVDDEEEEEFSEPKED